MGLIPFVMWLGMMQQSMESPNIICTHLDESGQVIDHDCDWVITDPPEPPIMTLYPFSWKEK